MLKISSREWRDPPEQGRFHHRRTQTWSFVWSSTERGVRQFLRPLCLRGVPSHSPSSAFPWAKFSVQRKFLSSSLSCSKQPMIPKPELLFLPSSESTGWVETRLTYTTCWRDKNGHLLCLSSYETATLKEKKQLFISVPLENGEKMKLKSCRNDSKCHSMTVILVGNC